MDSATFKRQRDDLDMTVEETCTVLEVARASVTAWQSGRYRVPSWVDEKFAEMRETRDASKSERDVRRKIEDMYSDLSSRLYLGEVPDGWLSMIEHFLHDLDQFLPEGSKDGKTLSLHLKEKWGGMRVSTYFDTDDLDLGERFWSWIQPRIERLEDESERTCARCGSNDDVSLTKSGWILPLCRRHRLLREGEL